MTLRRPPRLRAKSDQEAAQEANQWADQEERNRAVEDISGRTTRQILQRRLPPQIQIPPHQLRIQILPHQLRIQIPPHQLRIQIPPHQLRIQIPPHQLQNHRGDYRGVQVIVRDTRSDLQNAVGSSATCVSKGVVKTGLAPVR